MVTGIDEFLKTASVEQRSLLFKLADLAEKEKELSKKINSICSSVNTGIYSDGEGITVCENEDDMAIISLGPRLELKEVRDEIADLLKKAVTDLGMGDVGIIQRQYKNYVKEEK